MEVDKLSSCSSVQQEQELLLAFSQLLLVGFELVIAGVPAGSVLLFEFYFRNGLERGNHGLGSPIVL